MVNDENIEFALARFQELIARSSQDAPAVVLVEGGRREERLEIAKLFRSIAEEIYPVAGVDLYADLDRARIGGDRSSLDLVTTTIRQLVGAHLEQRNRAIVFLYNYEHVYQIDDRLRPFLMDHQRVLAWVIVSRRLLSESRDASSSGRFRGYRNDDRVGSVIVARPPGVNARHVRRNNGTRKTVASNLDDASSLNAPPTRVQIDAALRAREGQAAFRAALLRVFGGRCAVTGCAVDQLLEAAHIEPYSEGQNHRIGNGLILRADIHTLFDKGLLAIGPLTPPKGGKIFVAESLQSDPTYGPLQGAFIDLPLEDAEVRRAALLAHFCNSLVLG